LALFVLITAQRAGALDNPDSLLGTGLFYALLWAGVISNVVFTALVTFFARRETPIVLKFDFDWWKRTFQTSLPYGLALILQTLYLRIDVIIISIMLGSVAVGIYGVGTRILESLLILGVFFGQAILPRISAQEHDHDGGEKTLSWGMHILLLFSLPIILAFYKFSPDIIRILSSEEYMSTPGFFGSDSVMRFLIFTVFFAYFNQLFIFTLVAKNRQSYLLWVNLFAVVLNAGLNVMFLPFYGLKAAAVATILSEIVVFALLLKEILRHFHPHIWNKGMVVILFANALLGGLLFFTPLGNHIWWAAGVGSVVYFGILAVFRKCFLPGE
jgi:O-antigen/teichoic acid export membrane protein